MANVQDKLVYLAVSIQERHKIVKLRARALAPRLQSVVGMNAVLKINYVTATEHCKCVMFYTCLHEKMKLSSKKITLRN